MKVSRSILVLIVGGGLLIVPSLGWGLQAWSKYGDWPGDWPKELDQVREQSASFTPGPIITTTIYYIPFYTRVQFEEVWPGFVKLCQESTRMTLYDAPEFPRPEGKGDRILDKLEINAPALIMVITENEHWVREDRAPAREASGIPGDATPEVKDGMVRVPETRKSISIMTDGEIIDLNRICFPKGHPIYDDRSAVPASSDPETE